MGHPTDDPTSSLKRLGDVPNQPPRDTPWTSDWDLPWTSFQDDPGGQIATSQGWSNRILDGVRVRGASSGRPGDQYLLARLLIYSVKTLCLSLLNLCCVFNVDLLSFINSLILSMSVLFFFLYNLFYSQVEFLLNSFHNFQI